MEFSKWGRRTWLKHQDNLKRDNEKNETRLFIGFNLVF